MTDILATEAATPITAADVVAGEIFVMSAFAQTMSGPKFSHHFPILILPFHPNYPELVHFRTLSLGGSVRKTSHRIEHILKRIHRPTEADKARITRLVTRAQHEIDDRQEMINALKPYTDPAEG